MSVEDIEKAFELIESHNIQTDFDGPKPADLLEKAEDALNLSFPASYRAFLNRFGCGGVSGEEFYGIVNDDFINSSVPDAIWVTLDERKMFNLPKSHIIVSSTGDGGYYAIDCSKSSGENESPVVEWWAGPQLQKEVAKDFGEFFLRSIREALE
jgi:hypothetical protein